jgi:hypothetical protein
LPTEIRYFDTQSASVHGLSCYGLRTAYTPGTIGQIPISGYISPTLVTGSWGIRVWKRDVAGNETEITRGTPVATSDLSQAIYSYGSGNYTPNQTSLASSDSIVVRVYIKIGTQDWSQVNYAIFTTEQLGAVSLDSNPWTVWYNKRIEQIDPTHFRYWYYWVYGNSPDLEDYIDGFKWTPVSPPPSPKRVPSVYNRATTTIFIGA